MTDQAEVSRDAGDMFIAWQHDSRGFPVALYSGDTVDEAIERLIEGSG